jgi:hypothetical protein
VDDEAGLRHALRAHWESQGLVASCIDLARVAQLRARHQGLAEPYLALLLEVGVPAGDDRQGFRFWQPPELLETSIVLATAGYKCHSKHRSLIVADYLQESWWYAIWLEGPWLGMVSRALGTSTGDDPVPPLGTFTDFVRAYLADDARLYGGAGH